ESFLSSRAFKRGIEMPLLMDVSRLCVLMLLVLGMMRTLDLVDRHVLGLLVLPKMETYMFVLEIVVGLIAPLILLSIKRVRTSQSGLFFSSVLVILGFVMNRMNITITGMEGWAGKTYVPSLSEFSITLAIVTAGFVAFYYIAKYFPVFSPEEHDSHATRQSEEVWSGAVRKSARSEVMISDTLN
ncbi:MAG TPA: hypothetical protein VK470_12980, partial [Bacteroidota bacterium]|nr:hypothetical protein [Bacteroidota bacterium]